MEHEACPLAAAAEDACPRWTRVRCPVTMTNLSVLCALLCLICPIVAHSAFFVYRLVFGTLYPAYASYKAVRSRDVREYVKWMMYWIVFALFTCGETITDVFLSFWFPFYYEIKIGFVLWLLSPATKGSSILYRKFVHPMLTNREQEIDEYIARAKEQGYHTVLHLGSKGVNYATNVIMQTAIKGGGGLVNQLRKSYSLSDLTEGEGEPVGDVNRNGKDVDGLEYRGNRRADRVDGSRPSNRARGYSPRRSASGSARMEMYFPEVDLEVRQRRGSSRSREPSVPLSHIRSSEDVSYMSGNHFYEDASEMDTDQTIEESGSLPVSEGPLVRTASVGSTRTTRTKGALPRTSAASTTTTAAKKAAQGEDVEVSSSEEEDFWSDPPDEISPYLDRTIFVNDPNTFPTHHPRVTVESIICSTDLVHDVDVDLDSSIFQRDSGGSVEQQKTEVEKVKESQPHEVFNPTSDVSPVQISSQVNKSEDTRIAKVTHTAAYENSEIPEDNKTSDSCPSCPSDDESSSKTLTEYPLDSVSLKRDTVRPVGEISSEKLPGDESHLKQSSSIALSSISETLAIGETKEENHGSLNFVDSGSTLPTNNHDAAEKGTCSEEKKNLADDSTAIDSSEVFDSSKTSEVPIKNEIISPVSAESVLAENVSSNPDNILKEEQGSDVRGGRYHKPPAPRPPQQESSTLGSSVESEEKCAETGKSVRARLVLKPGIVRSLPDVSVASASNAPVKSEVFMAVNNAPWSRLSSMPSPHASPKPSRKSKLLSRSLSKGKADKGAESSGFPRFLKMTGSPHLGSLTSIFPFWHGGLSMATSSPETISDGKEEKKSVTDAKGSGASRNEKVKMGEEEKNVLVSGGGSAAVKGVKQGSQFPVHRLSHSPTRYGANRKM
ncbi:uncharacterized protein [Hetaerina americana]|uniref:uncharacterized protein isoform X2 n=1 Tax=Hetaerina americana TaxID=62018 RepID=UPI003A7F53B4